MDEVGELVGRQLIREVDEQAVDGGHRNLLVGRELARVEPPNGVHLHAFGPRAPAGRDGDARLTESAHLVQGAARVVAERAVDRERRRQPLTLTRERRLPDDVDPAIPPVQHAPSHALRDRARRHHGQQLQERDEPVLSRRDSGDPRVDGGVCRTAAKRCFVGLRHTLSIRPRPDTEQDAFVT